MAYGLTDLGEEWALSQALEGASVNIGLYDDSTDAISETDDIGAITTEPSDGNYARQAATLTLTDDGDWAAVTDADVVYDVTNTTGTVDSYFITATFTASDTEDSSDTEHLIGTGALEKERDLSQIDQLTENQGMQGVKLT